MATFDGNDDIDTDQTPIVDRMNKEYKIYVDNLPQELNEDAIRQVFNPYGKITGMFYRPNATWAFITYGSYREAEFAIRELNNQKPLYLKVALAKEKAVKEELERLGTQTEEKPYFTEPLLIQNMKHTPQGTGRGYTIRKCIMPNMISHKYIPHHERAQVFPSLSTVSNAYENDDPYRSTNNLWTRGMLTVTADGKRHVSLGRGYSMYEIPEPDPRCEEYITQMYELRKNGLYEYADDKLKNGLQKCIVCSVKTTKHCEKCHTYYCSKICQITHWPQHQVECERIPDLVDETSSEEVVKSCEATKPQTLDNTRVQVNAFSDVKLRRPNTPVQIQSLNTNIQRMNETNQIDENAKAEKYPKNQLDNKGNVPKEKVVDQPAINATNNRTLQNRLNMCKSNENIDQTKNDQFSATVNHTRQNYTCGYKNDFTNKTYLDKETNKNGHVRDKFSNNVDKNDQKDGFQNDRKPPYNNRETTTTISTTTATTNNKQGQKMSMLSMDAEKTMAVEVEKRSDNCAARTTKDLPQSSNTSNATVKAQGKSSPNTEITPATQLCNILDVFTNSLTKTADHELTVSGMIQIFERVQKNVYGATLVPDDFTENMEKIINDLPEVCINMTKTTSNYKPKVGDLVCGEVENGIWYRGYVTSSPDLRIAVVDEAKIVPAIRAVPYPKEFLDICAYGVICEVTNDEVKMDEIYSFTGVMKEHDKKQSSLEIKIRVDNNTIKAVIKPWQPAIKSVPALAELKNGSKICLTNYRNQYIMFAHSLDESEIEYTNDIMQRVAHCSQTAPHLSKLPSIEQMVIAPFIDGNKYRAMITKIQDNKTATIVYVDFGNFTDINVAELQEIPDNLALKRSCSAKLLLKDVPRDIAMTAEVDAYLRDLVGREEPLVCIYDNGLFKNGVYLTTNTGENVNDKIKELLIPGWKKDNYDDKTCYMINDMDIAPLGNVGDTVEALVLYKGENNELSYMMGPSDLDLITHVTSELPAIMQDYCDKTQYYIPRKEELCLALYDEAWYRALCIDPKKSQTTCEIFFVDYGNIELVEHQNVRQMPVTFIRPPSMANICKVVNLAPVDNTGNYSAAVKQKVSELVTVNMFVDIKIVEFVQSGEYKIELPKIRAALKKEGLVPSSF